MAGLMDMDKAYEQIMLTLTINCGRF